MISIFHGVTYCKHFVDPATGEIVHTMTSDDPIDDSMVIEEDPGNLQPTPIFTPVMENLECDSLIRAKDLFGSRQYDLKTKKVKMHPAASAEIKSRIKRELNVDQVKLKQKDRP